MDTRRETGGNVFAEIAKGNWDALRSLMDGARDAVEALREDKNQDRQSPPSKSVPE